MSTKIRDRIDTRGLINYIDAAYPKSITNNEISWRDVMKKYPNSTLINGAYYSDSPYLGKVNFDGIDDWVSIPYNYNLTTEPFAVEIWRDHVRHTTGGYRGILATGNVLGSGPYGSPGWSISYYTSDGTNIIASIADSTGFNNRLFFQNVTNIVPFGKPMHIFFHRNTNSQTMSMFINGIKSSIGLPNTVNIGGANRKFISGQIWTFSSEAMIGAYYMVKLYMNENYEDNEIIQKFNSTKARFGL